MQNSFESRENNILESLDRISSLPDPILGVILSFLPTKNVVATSILSKRWKLMWTTVHNLDFCYELCFGQRNDEDEAMRFAQFVNYVLLHTDARLLIKFRLVWSPWCVLSYASSWINTAIARNVHELCLFVESYVCPHGRLEPFEIPISVFSCASLQSLELDGGINVSSIDGVCLPRLKHLKLVAAHFSSGEALGKLISGCPMLDSLHMHTPSHMTYFFGQDDDFTYMISSTSLRRLEICIDYLKCERDRCYHRYLKLEASSLEYLKLVGFIPRFFVGSCLNSLTEVDFKFHLTEFDFSKAYICNSITKAVRFFNCAKTLTLSTDVMRALSYGRLSLSIEFKRLVNLKTKTCCYGRSSSLLDFVQSSDNLKILTVYLCPDYSYERCRYDLSKWTAPTTEVPRCLSNSLRKIVFDDFRGSEVDRGIILYMLEHGSALEVMEIFCYSGRNVAAKFKLVQEICQYPRKSKACEVKFFGWISEEGDQGDVTTTTA